MLRYHLRGRCWVYCLQLLVPIVPHWLGWGCGVYLMVQEDLSDGEIWWWLNGKEVQLLSQVTRVDLCIISAAWRGNLLVNDTVEACTFSATCLYWWTHAAMQVLYLGTCTRRTGIKESWLELVRSIPNNQCPFLWPTPTLFWPTSYRLPPKNVRMCCSHCCHVPASRDVLLHY